MQFNSTISHKARISTYLLTRLHSVSFALFLSGLETEINQNLRSKTLCLKDTMSTVWIICQMLRLIGFCLLHRVGFPNFLFISKKQMLRVMQNTLKSYHHQFILPLLGKNRLTNSQLKDFYDFFRHFCYQSSLVLLHIFPSNSSKFSF